MHPRFKIRILGIHIGSKICSLECYSAKEYWRAYVCGTEAHKEYDRSGQTSVQDIFTFLCTYSLNKNVIPD